MTTYQAYPQLVTSPTWRVGERTLTFDRRRVIMGILNVTPDSFSDGGDYYDLEAAVAHGLKLAREGAGIVDVGGESTRPGAEPVSAEEEMRRVVPVLQRLSAALSASSTLLSVDTTKAVVAEAALAAGAHIVNDVSGLGFDPGMAGVVARHQAALVLMHLRGTPQTMEEQALQRHEDVVEEEIAYFQRRLDLAQEAGIDLQRVVLDPGIGFGKTTAENFRLLREVGRLSGTLGRPILLGTSRKKLISDALGGRDVDEREWGTAATVACGVLLGAHVIRVHDVQNMSDVIRVTEAVCATDGACKTVSSK